MNKTNDKTWYVQAEPENRGPFSEDDLRQQRLAGEITDDTPVWNFGMYEWEPLSQACPKACAGTRPPPKKPPSAKPSPAAPSSQAIPVSPEPLTMESIDLTKPAAAPTPPPHAHPLTAELNPTPPPREPGHAETLINDGWEALRTYPIEGAMGWMLWVLVSFGMYQTMAGGTWIGGIVFLMVLALGILPLVMCGMSRFAARWHLEQHPGQLELLAPILFVKRWKNLARLTGASFVPTVAIHLAAFLISLCGESAYQFIEDRHFVIFLIEYGLLLGIIGRFYPAYLLVIDQDMEARAAFDTCMKMTRGPAGQAAGTFLLTLICINLVGLLPCGIGLLVTLPVTMISGTLFYFRTCGIAEDLAKPPPGMEPHH